MRNTRHARKSIDITPCGSVQFWLGVWSYRWEGVGGVRGCRNITDEKSHG